MSNDDVIEISITDLAHESCELNEDSETFVDVVQKIGEQIKWETDYIIRDCNILVPKESNEEINRELKLYLESMLRVRQKLASIAETIGGGDGKLSDEYFAYNGEPDESSLMDYKITLK